MTSVDGLCGTINAGQLVDWAREKLGIDLRISKRPPGQTGFKVLPRRWIVERSLFWTTQARRNARDYERLPQVFKALITWAAIRADDPQAGDDRHFNLLSTLWQTRRVLTFTDAFLQPEPGTITHWPTAMDSPAAGTWSIEIPLRPWSADDEFDPDSYRPGTDGPEHIQASLMLEFVDMPADELDQLSDRRVAFPPSPQPGCAEGSIYLLACHCPIEVSSITFGTATDKQITAEIRLAFDFVSAGGIDIHNRTAELHALLRLASPSELRAAFENASQ